MTDVVWLCEVTALPSGDLTVGAPFELNCTGPNVPNLTATNLSLELPKADRFRLQILENKKTTTSAVEFRVTSYVAGETKLQDVILTDGNQRIKLTGIDFNVTSVIKEGEQPEPFPPAPPVGLSWPIWVWGGVGFFFALILGIFVLAFRARLKRQKFKAWLDSERTPMSPRDHLSREMRRAVKERDPQVQIRTLEMATRRFLSFEFNVFLMEASTAKILKIVLQNNKREAKRLTPLTIRLFGEFERVAASLKSSTLSADEARNVTLPQIHELTREFADTLSHGSRSQKARRA